MTLSVLIAVTHLLGAGHLTRAAAIGRALARRGHRVTLVTGGTPTPLVDMAAMAVVQLPPVRTRVGDFTTLLDANGRPIEPDHLASRRDTLLAAFAAARPDVVVTELYPFGRRVLRTEFEALLDAADAAELRPVILCSVRDILAPPSRPEKAEAAHAVIARRYRAVLVHGDEATVPLERSWPVDDALRRRLVYTGYIGPEAALASPGTQDDGSVLVSGGSSAAALPLYRAAIEAARADAGRPWRILVGKAVGEADHGELRDAAPPNAIVERARPDFVFLLAKAAVFVGQAGYNTVMDIVATHARSVLVPFEQGRETEQRLRAEGLAASGLATLLAEGDLTPTALGAAIAHAAGRPRPTFQGIALDGHDRAAQAIEALAREGRS
ncbi:glycosyltransferase family protein [Enterovirga rhinocerotis]|uniref:Putative glycosyltransferase n=1 Tax=Enterovirga rhinocerotis TaxID=1339210 RepID=A0A4R7C9F5_9HYPH|nr:glycosyltransferase [Enterovirga rhinocerotis]TDR93975.1 putative glycosyltransferase [Enterovirga rhinocerotis]